MTIKPISNNKPPLIILPLPNRSPFAQNLLEKINITIDDLRNPRSTEYPFEKNPDASETIEACRLCKNEIDTPEIRAISAGTGSGAQQRLFLDGNYNTPDTQEYYNHFHQCTVHYIATILQTMNPNHISLFVILHMIGQLRQTTAEQLCHDDPGYFGLWRPLHPKAVCSTPITPQGRYGRYHRPLTQIIQQFKNLAYQTTVSLKKFTGKKITISECRPPVNCQLEFCVLIVNTAKNEEIALCIDSLQDKMRLFMKTRERDVSLLIKQLADIHWFLAHLSPFMRGSAATTEILIQALCVAKGISPPRLSGLPENNPTQPLIFSDLEALTQKRETFIKNYPRMIEQLSSRR